MKNGAAMNKQLKDSRYCLNLPKHISKIHGKTEESVDDCCSCQLDKQFETKRACKDIEDEILRLLSAEGDILESKEFDSPKSLTQQLISGYGGFPK